MQLHTTMHDFVLTLRRRAVPGLKALCLGCEEEQAALPRIETHMKIEDVYYIHVSMVHLLLSILLNAKLHGWSWSLYILCTSPVR